MADKHSSKYELFAAFYIGEAGFNATEAARLAGFKAKNRHSLQVQASQILQRPDVQEYIRLHVQNTGITQEELLEELADLARWSWQDNIGHVASMESAKVFDTMMRGKVKAMSDLLKIFDGDAAKELVKIRKAMEQHRLDHPDMSDTDRLKLFKQHVDPELVEKVFAELMKNEENRRRLKEAEAIDADPMTDTVE